MSASLATTILTRALTTTTRRRSAWARFGKWVLIGVLVGVAILALLLVCCCVVLRKAKKSKAAKHNRDTEAGAYKTEKVHQQPVYNAPTQPPPARMEPAYNGNVIAHDAVTYGERPNAHYNNEGQTGGDFVNTAQMYNGNGQSNGNHGYSGQQRRY